MRAFFPFLLLLLLFSCGEKNNPDQQEWIHLFNGKDLTGWTPKIRGFEVGDNVGNTFQIKDSSITVSYAEYDSFRAQFGHLFYKEKFSHYLLSIQYRFVEQQAAGGEGWAERNSGVMVHGQTPESMGKNQDFPISIEVQLLGGLGKGERPTANLCTPGTHVYMKDTLFTTHCINSTSSTFEGDQWVNVQVVVLGDSLLAHLVNGDTVMRYSKPQIGGGVVNGYDPSMKRDGSALTEGTISLQSESHPVQFRKVDLLNLKGCRDKAAKNYKSYLLMHDAKSCVY